MSTASTPSTIEEERQPFRIRNAFGSVLFAAAQEVPRLLHPRRNQHSWFVFRIALGLFGVALVLLPLALPQSWIAAIVGLGFFLTAILLPSALAHSAEDEKASELSAQFVLDGGKYCEVGFTPVPVQLFVSAEQISALDSKLQPVVDIPTRQLSAVLLQRSEGGWLLVLQWAGQEAEFAFHGLFAERHARKAEGALRGFVQPPAPRKKVKARAAGV